MVLAAPYLETVLKEYGIQRNRNCTGCILTLFLIAGFNGTSFYPSSYDLQSSLTIQNASSSLFTLKTMMYVSFLIPFIMAYIWYAWKAINNNKITEDEMNSDGHVY